MALVFMLRSFDGQPGGATYFELHLEGEGPVVTSEGVYSTPGAAMEDIRRLVFACQYRPGYACDVAVDPTTWEYGGLFPDPQTSQHLARTQPCDTEAEVRQLIDLIFASVSQAGDQIPVAGPVYDGPTDIVDSH